MKRLSMAEIRRWSIRLVAGFSICGSLAMSARKPNGAGAADLGNGYTDLGIAAPVSSSRGLALAEDGKGRSVALVWLNDYRGGYALLQIDATTGKSVQRPVPFVTGGDTPFTSFLSSGNKYYAHFGDHFSEYDPVTRAFTFWTNTAPTTAFSIIEDERGVIWSVTYPQSGLVSFDPKTRSFKDYGQLYKQNWNQYPGNLSLDDAGWVYWGVGNARCQIIAFDPGTGTVKPLIPEDERHPGAGDVFRATNGMVYVSAGRQAGWLACRAGEARGVEGKPPERKKAADKSKPMTFPDGRRLAKLDLEGQTLWVENAGTNTTTTVRFDYESGGAPVMGVALAPDGTLCGGTTHPAYFFSYNPATGRLSHRPGFGQWNAMARQGDLFYAGTYTGGSILEWNPSRPWVDTKPGNTNSNPRHLGENREVMNRPHKILPLPDGHTVVMGGTAGYGATGAGLVFWDSQSRTKVQVAETNILPHQATLSLVALPGGKILGGSTVRPGTGGERKAEIAELYIMDVATKKLEWHQAVLTNAHEYTDMCPGPRGLVFGLADGPVGNAADRLKDEDGRRFFVFDPARKAVIHEQNTEPEFGPVSYQQGYRKLLTGPDGRYFILFTHGIAEVDPDTYKITLLAKSPVAIECGGDIAEGRIYFASGSRLYSYEIPSPVPRSKP